MRKREENKEARNKKPKEKLAKQGSRQRWQRDRLQSHQVSDLDRELFLDAFYQGEFLRGEKFSQENTEKISDSELQASLDEDEDEDEKELFLRAIQEGTGGPKYIKKELYDEDKSKRRARKRNAIDAKIDLHGMIVEDAINALYKFLEREKKRGSRTILVVHGKGTGILKTAVWSLIDSLPCVLDFQIAPAKLGGNGAILVRIGRKTRS